MKSPITWIGSFCDCCFSFWNGIWQTGMLHVFQDGKSWVFATPRVVISLIKFFLNHLLHLTPVYWTLLFLFLKKGTRNQIWCPKLYFTSWVFFFTSWEGTNYKSRKIHGAFNLFDNLSTNQEERIWFQCHFLPLKVVGYRERQVPLCRGFHTANAQGTAQFNLAQMNNTTPAQILT